MSAPAQTLRQFRYTNRSFWRNSAAAVFTCAFPVIFLVLLGAVFGGGSALTASGVTVASSKFYVPTMIVFAVVSACFTNIVMSVTIQRDYGVLKRLRGTPLRPGSYLGGRILHSMFVSVLLMAICWAIGIAFFRVGFNDPLPSVLTLLIGAASFCALGLAMTAAIPDAHAASPIVNAIILPVLLISNVFVPPGHLPFWLNAISLALPVRHFSDAMQKAFFPATSRYAWLDLAIVAAWGIAGVVLALRFFSWEPRR